MVCYRAYKALPYFLMLSVIGLVGCGGGSKGNVKPDNPEVELATVGEEGQTEQAFVAIPDPYLAQSSVPSASAQKAFNGALQAMQQQDWQRAHQLLVQLTERHSDLSGPWVNLGIVESRLGDVEAAERALAKAIEINPLNNDAYNQAALVKREQGKFAEAEALYVQALEVWPHSFESNRNLGILYDLYMGKFDLAMKRYELAAKLAPETDREIKGWVIDLKRRLKQ